MNSCIFTGRLVRDIELKSTSNGTLVVNNCIAVRRAYSKNKETDFIEFTAWGKAADTISRYFHKGSMICLRGDLQTRQDEYKGVKVTKYILNVNEFDFMGDTSTNINVAPPADSNESIANNHNDFEEIGGNNDDLPF